MDKLVSVIVHQRHEDSVLDREIEIAVFAQKPKSNKIGGSDGLVGELLKYGG